MWIAVHLKPDSLKQLQAGSEFRILVTAHVVAISSLEPVCRKMIVMALAGSTCCPAGGSGIRWPSHPCHLPFWLGHPQMPLFLDSNKEIGNAALCLLHFYQLQSLRLACLFRALAPDFSRNLFPANIIPSPISYVAGFLIHYSVTMGTQFLRSLIQSFHRVCFSQ